MKKLNYLKSAIDGVLHFLGIKILILFTQKFYSSVSLNCIITFSIAIPILIAIVYFIMLYNEHSNKNIILSSVCGVVAFVLLLIIDFVIILMLSNSSNSTDDYAWGIILITSLFIFIAVSFVLKIGVLLVLISRNKRQNNKTGDGSMSAQITDNR